MHVIGILGGVASGKSLVTRQLAELGAGVLDADRAGHAVLGLAEVEAVCRQRWGEAIFDASGRIDRRKLAAIVFGADRAAENERRFLEEITHPRIRERLQLEAGRMEAEGRLAVVLDAPLLLEAGWGPLCDRLVFVDAPQRLRLERATARGWTEAEFEARQQAQESVDWKRRHADVIIDNSGSPEAMRAQVERLWRSLVG